MGGETCLIPTCEVEYSVDQLYQLYGRALRYLAARRNYFNTRNT